MEWKNLLNEEQLVSSNNDKLFPEQIEIWLGKDTSECEINYENKPEDTIRSNDLKNIWKVFTTLRGRQSKCVTWS